MATRHPVRLKVAYHDACHLAPAQKVRSQPRQLLGGIPELELVEPAEWEICCGSAGIHNLLQPDAGQALGRRNAENRWLRRQKPSHPGTPAAPCRSPPTSASRARQCRSTTP
ncbi:MAG: heterodisulfide reductase-related iron-sulfur binding cluster [Acidimicrobiales bacterium]